MRLIKDEDSDKDFTPFTLRIKVETVEEARTFFHIFNNSNLVDKIKKGWYYDADTLPNDGYQSEISNLNNDQCIYRYIREKIEKNGEKV